MGGGQLTFIMQKSAGGEGYRVWGCRVLGVRDSKCNECNTHTHTHTHNDKYLGFCCVQSSHFLSCKIPRFFQDFFLSFHQDILVKKTYF